MIVNCFPIFRAVILKRDEIGMIDAKSTIRVATALRDTFELSEHAFYECLTGLMTADVSDWWDAHAFTITPAETRLLRTIVRWMETAIGEDFEDGWGMTTRSTTSFAFENHNRAVGVMLTRIGETE